MSLNIALTGIEASNTMLTTVSDNIANANTTGFKRARAEFADLVDSMSQNGEGLGVRLQRMTQTFKQGTIATTDNPFDMAITGDGFFQVKNGNSTFYTRAGSFRADTSGFIVDNSLQNVQGYQVQVSDPAMTSEITFGVTLEGNGLINDPAVTALNPNDPLTYNHATSIDIVDSKGFSHTLKSFFMLTTSTSIPPAAGTNTWHVYHQLDGGTTIIDGGAVDINNATGVLTPVAGPTPIPLVTALSIPAADLGTGADPMSISLKFQDTTTTPATMFLKQGATFDSASLIANGSLRSREVTNSIGNLKIDASTMQPKITGMVSLGLNLNALESAPIPTTTIQYTANLDGSLTATTTPPTNLTFDPDDPTTYNDAAGPSTHTNVTQIYDSLGINHTLKTFLVKVAADTWDVHYTLDGNYYPGTVSGTNPNGANGGQITFTATTGAPTLTNAITPITFTSSQLGSGASDLIVIPDFNNLLQIPGNTATAADNLSETQSVVATSSAAGPNTIDATDASNYQYSTAMTIYDSLGINHTLNLYFRKTADNTWNVYRQFAGIDSTAVKVGALAFDSIGTPVKAMDTSGYTDPKNPLSLNMLGISFGNGAGRQNIELNFADTTQFDSRSITNTLNQDGYTMGSLSGIEVDSSGNIIASYSNDKTQVMGQVMLARFANTQGLKRVGDNNWVATGESGQAITGKPGDGSTGKLVTSALEGSNVELTKELVDMLIAQRSFQANSQVINTSGTLYQSILNIRS